MSMFVHRAERTDLLADELAEVLRIPPDDPFAADVVAVPTKGVERFLAQRLALVLGTGPGGSDGVCANVQFPSPDDVVTSIVAAVTGEDAGSDPWHSNLLRWVVLAELDRSLSQPWAAPLRRYLLEPGDADSDSDAGRRGNGRLLALADRVAAIFGTYDRERPHLVRAWAAGDDTDGAGTGTAHAIPADLSWQPELWRRVRAAVGRPSPAERLPAVGDALAAGTLTIPLPQRVSVFGPTRLPLQHLQVLTAAAVHRDIHLWLPDPSPGRWAGSAESPPGRHPLLRSLGRDSAELATRLRAELPPEPHETVAAPPKRPATLLGWLQEDLSADQPPTDVQVTSRAVVDTDRSVQVHACHGRHRQVEVLREVLLGLLQRDPTLQPRDILVMCPDVAEFAPLVTAAFAVGNTRLHTPAQDLRIRVADRTPEQGNPLLTALDALLTAAGGRLTATDVLGLAAVEPVARRFGFDTDTLDRLQVLVASTGVRWGLDRADRDRFDVDTDQNTWRHGLDRMLAGVAMSHDDLRQLGGVLPLDDVADQDVSKVGRLAEFVDRLAMWVPRLRAPQTAAQWFATLADTLAALTEPPRHEQWQSSAALAALHRILAPDSGCDVALEYGDIRVLLGELLAGRPTRTNFRTGGVTVCSLVPMRSVPHRVVCLLGVDDGVFPRPHVVDGNDLIARTRRPGERDRTSEDRHVLLDAIMAATDVLMMLHTGFDEHTNEDLPAAVPVLELLDTLDRTAAPAPGATATCVREFVVTRHPLQPFDPRNFTAGALGPGVFSHDSAALAGARASVAAREAEPPLVPAPLPPERVSEVQLADLSTFLRDPPGFFLRRRLRLHVSKEDEPGNEELPVELVGLDFWQVGTRVLCALRDDGTDVDVLLRAERARGALPPGRLGDDAVARIRTMATTVLDRAQPYLQRDRHDEPVAIELNSGVRVVGSVSDVHGNGVTTVQFGAVHDKQVADLWVRVLALSAARNRPCGGVVVGKESGGQYGAKLLLGDHDPVTLLSELVDVFQRGLQEPVPLTPRSSCRYVRERPGQADSHALQAVRDRLWNASSRGAPADCTDPAITALWGTDDPFTAVTAIRPRPDERPWFPDDTTRFGVLSRRVWEPILACWESLR